MTPSNPNQPDSAELLAAICELSHRYGADESHVIAGGGNASCKNATTLWVKGSGTELATIEPDGFVEMDRAALQKALDSDFGNEPAKREELYKNALMAARVHPDRGQRPSVETLMHHLAAGRYVVHTHSNLVNQLTCCVNGQELVKQLFGDRVLWVSYVDPGYALSKHIQGLLVGHAFPDGAPTIMMMENHGLVVAAADAATVEAAIAGLSGEIAAFIADQTEPSEAAPAKLTGAEGTGAGAIERLFEAFARKGEKMVVECLADEAVASFLGREDARQVALSGPLTPDQIVYCKSFPMWLKQPDATVGELAYELGAFHAKRGHYPKTILVPGVGLATAGPDARAARVAQRVYRDAILVMLGADRLGGIHFMSERDRQFIDNWEVENYRRQVSAGG